MKNDPINEYIVPDWEATMLNQFADEEEVERIEIKVILDEIYKDRTVFLEPKKQAGTALVVDLTLYCKTYCSNCGEYKTFEASGNERMIYSFCPDCNKLILDLERND